MPRKLYAIKPEPYDDTEAKWVREHGEVFKNYAECGQHIGYSSRRVQDLVRDGYLDITPSGKVLVRSAARWANSNRRRGVAL